MIMPRLKEATRPHHEAIETRIDVFRMGRTIEGYRRVLERFLGYYEPVEEAFGRISGWDVTNLDPDERKKAPLLKADLLALGLENEAIAALPRCRDLPSLTGLAEAFGAMYVLEGATLGGQYIRKSVASEFGIGPDSGCAFFSSYGDRVGPMWKAFGAALTDYATTPEIEDAVIRSAIETFEAINGWFAADV
ncbi:MAG: biliverdin-producing heme oxygenase [Paludisphaera borealis]|uniref:biliverdin-producing heme oxygenase n=1 Tax=Paludisphaera borealis TaxID=1387353 RepID=UPI0028487014|nr:biliverdin-producing heme oxygenase [Paludisphaera borealis]MDR3619771.1 biliverdin-producing heme oxygenase [Paludisphaera borealis]